MTNRTKTSGKPARPGAVELAEDRLDVSAGANGLFRLYGDVNGDGTAPRPPQLKTG